MLATTQTWFGTTRTMSPTFGRSFAWAGWREAGCVGGPAAHDVADFRAVVRLGEIEEAVLLGELADAGVRVFEDEPVPVEARAGVAGERFGPGIQDPPRPPRGSG